MQEFFTIISNFGFPVAVAAYLLFRYEKILSGLQVTNAQLVEKNTTLVEKNTILIDKNDELIQETRGLKVEITKLRKVIDKRMK